MKKVLFLILTMLMSLSAFSHDIEVANSDGVTIYYNWENNKTELSVTFGESSPKYIGKVVIPASVTYEGNTYPVTSIVDYAFFDCYNLTSIEIPNSVTSIGINAFEFCSGLKKVIVKDIAAWCGISFRGVNTNPLLYAQHLYSDENTEITELIIPNSVTSIEGWAFNGCSSLTSITIPNSVTSIGDYAFVRCSGLTSITIPNSVTNIGINAFSDCSSLTSVTIPNSVTSIGENAFSHCSGLKKVIVKDIAAWCGISFWGDYSNPLRYAHHLYSDENTEITELIIPNSVTSIEGWAFNGCSSLTSITIPNSVTSIGDYAFDSCSGLTSVTIPNSVTSIGDYAFYNCSGLTSIIIPNSVTSIGGSAFDGCSGLKKVIVKDIAAWCGISFRGTYSNPLWYAHHLYSDENTEITELIIPNSVTSIEGWAFNGCSGLTSITIPNSVTSIGSTAFYGCSGLTSIIIPNSVTNIGINAFSDCSSLTSVTIPNNLTSIRGCAFSNCSSLTSVTIPNSVTSIEDNAFYNCKNLTDVYCYATNIPATANDAFDHCNIEELTLHVPEGMIDAYKAQAPWSEFGKIVELNETSIEFEDANVKAICVANWDRNKDGELSVDEAATVTAIGTVFNNNKEITSFNELSYFTGLTSIGERAFEGCTGLDSIRLPENVKQIELAAFKGCSKLTYLEFPNSLTTIGDSAFYQCSELKMIVSLIEKPFKFGSNAFKEIHDNCLLIVPVGKVNAYNEKGWTKKVFKDDVIDVDTTDTITFSDPVVKDICESNWDKDRNGVISMREASQVTALKSLFKSKTKITEFDEFQYFTGLTSLESSAFSGCSGLTSIILPKNLKKISGSAFKSCKGLTTITIPDSVTEIGGSAFYDCTGLTKVVLPDTLTKIIDAAFKHCTKLKEISIPDGVEEIGKEAFYGDTTLTKIKLPKSLTMISEALFRGCKNLKSVTIQDSVTVIISSKAFRDCYSLTDISLPQNLKEIGEGAFHNCSSLETITLPITLKEIGENAFNSCTSLDSIVSKITPNPFGFGANAFDDISKDCILWVPEGTKEAYIKAGWTRDVFKGGVVEIGDKSDPVDFDDDDEVEKICKEKWDINRDGKLTVNEAANVEALDTIFKGNNKIKSLKVLKDFTGLTSIADSAFADCSNLTTIELSESVINIGVGAFDKTAWYNNQPDGIVYAGMVAYKYKGTVPANTIVQLREGTLGIADKAFEKCESLASIEIPESVISIGEGAFWGCSGLESISVADANEIYDSRDDCNAIITKSDNTLIVGSKTTKIPESVKVIGNTAFWGNMGLESITIPNNVTAIGDSAFYDCKHLELVVSLIEKPFKFGRDAFTFNGKDNNCLLIVPVGEGMVDAYLNYGWTKKVFKGGVIEVDTSKRIPIVDPNVKKICIDNWDIDRDGELSEREASQVTSLGSLFRENTEIPENTKITNFNELEKFTGLTSLESYVFSGCSGLESITLPKNLTKIGNSAFKGCKSLTEITVPGLVTEIGGSAFYGDSSLIKVVLPDKLKKILDSAFRNCSSLTSITIPKNVEEIGESAFNGCKSLESVISKIEQPFEFGTNAFANISKYCILKVPDGTKENYFEKGWKEIEDGGVFKYIYEESEEQKPDEIKPGDVNEDGNIDITDAIMIVYYTLGVEQSNFNDRKADVNYNEDTKEYGDGVIDLTDAIQVVYWSLGVNVPQSNAKTRRTESVENESANRLFVNDIVIPEGGTADVDVLYKIDSAQKGVGFKFNLEVPEGLATVKDIEGIPLYTKDDVALSSFSILATEGDGFAAIPLTVTAGIQSGEGRLLTFTLKANPSLKKGDEVTAVIKKPAFTMKDSSGNVHTVTLPDISFKVRVTTATGIMDGISWKTDESTVYDVNGRKLKTVRKGVNIIDGNKVLVK